MVDYVAENGSGSPVPVNPEAILEDEDGERYLPDGSIEPPTIRTGESWIPASRSPRRSTLTCPPAQIPGDSSSVSRIKVQGWT